MNTQIKVSALLTDTVNFSRTFNSRAEAADWLETFEESANVFGADADGQKITISGTCKISKHVARTFNSHAEATAWVEKHGEGIEVLSIK